MGTSVKEQFAECTQFIVDHSNHDRSPNFASLAAAQAKITNFIFSAKDSFTVGRMEVCLSGVTTL